jgi:ferredoxin
MKIKSENKLIGFFQGTGYLKVFQDKKGIEKFKFLFGVLRIELKSIRHYFVIFYCKLSLIFNPKHPKVIADTNFIKDFEVYAKNLGVKHIGYTKVISRLLFKNRTAISPNAIILTLEMAKDKINKAPSKETFNMIHDTYHRLNMITIKLSKYIRSNGFSAQPSPATLGIAHYPPMAEKAGIGCRGWHGLLITPELGPRQRISMIVTSIDNLPFSDVNPHLWINEFCKKCHKCVKSCPVQAIPNKYELSELGYQRHLNALRCVDFFSQNYGCTICVKSCTFNNSDYDKIKHSFEKEK